MSKTGFYTLIAMLGVLAACTEPPGWQKLLTLKITEQYPGYKVKTMPDGSLLVERPGLASLPVDAEAIGRFCLRGPRDCNYASDQMLLGLAASK